MYFKIVYRLNDKNICKNYGHQIKAVIAYLQLKTLVCGLERRDE